MRTLPLATACLALLALGCRADNSTVLLERDLRLQEDKIWHLQSCLEDAQMAREATIRENEVLKQELSEARSSGPAGLPPSEDLAPPSVEIPSGGPPSRSREVPDLQPPTIELPESDGTPPVDAAPGNNQSTLVETSPTQLVINKRLTGGLDRDGRGGDEGLLVVFELRDATGHLAKWPGKVSVVAMDPALEGPAARVARWDIEADEVPGHYLNTLIGRGLQFELPWPSRPPEHKDLVLFVRFTTKEGEKLTSDTKITVRPGGDESNVDRQTEHTPRSKARGTARKQVPRSRLKARAHDRDAPRASRVPSTTGSAQSPFPIEEETVDEPIAEEEVPLQATRPKRPKWQPYR